jgi:hypothetical protein
MVRMWLLLPDSLLAWQQAVYYSKACSMSFISNSQQGTDSMVIVWYAPGW